MSTALRILCLLNVKREYGEAWCGDKGAGDSSMEVHKLDSMG